MNKTVKRRRVSRILSALFVLLFLSCITLAIVGVTYADKAHTPDHVLNYDIGRLFWADGVSDIYEDGTYRLNLFDSLPVGEDGMKIIAPGANDGGAMRLVNKTSHSVDYVATIFLINDAGVPITADFTNFNSLNRATDYTLPSDLSSAKVLRAVEGRIEGYGATDFYISWEWAFSSGAEGDTLDTAIGDLEISEVTLGVYLTVYDSLEPKLPTDDDGYLNIDTNGDYYRDTNLDTDNDGEAEINVDIDGDYIPDINIDTGVDYIPDINIDINGDCSPDFNFDNDSNGKPDHSILPFEIIDGVLKLDTESASMVFDAISGVDSKIKLDNFGIPLTAVEISSDALREYSERGGDLNLVYPGFVVYISGDALRDIADAAKGSSVTITANSMVKQSFNDRQIEAFGDKYVAIGVEFSVTSGGTLLNSKIDGGMEISVPHKLHEGTASDEYILYSVDKSGNLTEGSFEYMGDMVVFSIGDDAECVLLYQNGDLSDDIVTPEPPECSCIICLFGGGCALCWLCWLVMILAALLILVLIIGVILILIYGL